MTIQRKYLFLLRGAPACGKSTWIHENQLQDCTVSSDMIRLELHDPILDDDGCYRIYQGDSTRVWELVHARVEEMMRNTLPIIIIDATNAKIRDMRAYNEMASIYEYDVIVIDFQQNLTLEECLRRNALRSQPYQVPDRVVQRIYDTIIENDNLVPYPRMAPNQAAAICENVRKISKK